MKDFVSCVINNWSEDDQKDKHIYFEFDEKFLTVYGEKLGHRVENFFNLKNVPEVLELDVLLADNLPHFKMITDEIIWHFVFDYNGSLGFYSYSGDCSGKFSLETLDFEEIE